MCELYQINRYILCSQCDTLVSITKLFHGYKAFCPYCKTILVSVCSTSYYCFTTFITLCMLMLSNLFPFMKIKILGITKEISLLEIPYIMFLEKHSVLGIFFLLFVQIIPTFCLIVILLLVNRIRMIKSAITFLIRALFQLKNWSMTEIFLISVLISFIKIIKSSNIGVSIGISFIPWCIYCILQLQIFQCINRSPVWDSIILTSVFTQPFLVGVRGIYQNLRSCSCCTAILPAMQMRCSRCGINGYTRYKNSVQRTIALLITSIILYLPANIFPIMIIDFLGNKVSLTILTGIMFLWNEGLYSVATIIFIISILLPILKVIIITWLCCYAKGYGKYSSEYMYIIYKILECIRRWSMINVFIILIFSTLVRVGRLINIYPGIGILMFAIAVILTMFATITFDPRLLWDREIF